MRFLMVIALLFLGANAFALLGPTAEERAQFNSGRAATAVASGQIIVGNSIGYAEKQTLSGDGSMSNTGVLTLADVTQSRLSGITGAADDSDGILIQKIARATYTVTAVNSGTGSHDMGIDLPANAFIQNAFIRIDTAFTDAGSGTVEIKCEDADNIINTTDITMYGDTNFVQGSGANTVTSFSTGIAAACDVTLDFNTVWSTGGALTVWILYGVHE